MATPKNITVSRFHNLSDEALADAIGRADAIVKGAEAELAMLDGISHARKYFTNFVTILQAAEIRIICAAASAVAKDDPEGFAREA
jgi:hypothetical protein